MPRINPRRLPVIGPAATSGFSECEGCGKCCKNYEEGFAKRDMVVLWKPLSAALYEAATKLEYANA